MKTLISVIFIVLFILCFILVFVLCVNTGSDKENKPPKAKKKS